MYGLRYLSWLWSDESGISSVEYALLLSFVAAGIITAADLLSNAVENHLQRYVDEFAGRHGIRERDTIDQMGALVEGMVGKRLTYRDLVAG